MTLSRSITRYLLGIYELSKGTECVRSADLARFLGVSKASVVKMCAQLTQQGLIAKEYYGSITLTDLGVVEANRAYTGVVILEHLLETQFGVSAENARDDAVSCLCTLSQECADKIIQYALKQEEELHGST
ncbi:MAG: metal-dependent transcriptional regulator [Oscillospiraceae bacterium]|jgi:Mn-dependent DtxR family transcriptional regulator|nr:metal-dependent transcriptional regulator [Oscillospiraceae bacterium]MBQ8929715.1 metal-dependent transcriptional regulator [Oscillospiraceae bacterium]